MSVKKVPCCKLIDATATCLGTVRPPMFTASYERNPSSEPVPYWMANLVPLACMAPRIKNKRWQWRER